MCSRLSSVCTRRPIPHGQALGHSLERHSEGYAHHGASSTFSSCKPLRYLNSQRREHLQTAEPGMLSVFPRSSQGGCSFCLPFGSIAPTARSPRDAVTGSRALRGALSAAQGPREGHNRPHRDRAALLRGRSEEAREDGAERRTLLVGRARTMGRGRRGPFSISRPVSPGNAIRQMTAAGGAFGPRGRRSGGSGVCRRRGPEGRHRSPPRRCPTPPTALLRADGGGGAGRPPGPAGSAATTGSALRGAARPAPADTMGNATPAPLLLQVPNSPLRGGSPRRGADPLLVVVAPSAR